MGNTVGRLEGYARGEDDVVFDEEEKNSNGPASRDESPILEKRESKSTLREEIPHSKRPRTEDIVDLISDSEDGICYYATAHKTQCRHIFTADEVLHAGWLNKERIKAAPSKDIIKIEEDSETPIKKEVLCDGKETPSPSKTDTTQTSTPLSPSPSSPSSPPSRTHFPNDETTKKNYSFKKLNTTPAYRDGLSKHERPAAVKYKKEYWGCRSRYDADKDNKKTTCTARITKHHLPEGVIESYSGFHNHPPFKLSRSLYDDGAGADAGVDPVPQQGKTKAYKTMLPHVRQKALDQLKSGLAVSVVQKNLTLEATTDEEIPTISQLEGIQRKLTKEKFPTSIHFLNHSFWSHQVNIFYIHR